MSHGNSSREDYGGALDDYRRAKQLWQALARKQREYGGQTTFLLDQALLQDLGFTKQDSRANLRDLQSVLTRLQQFTWHWDRHGPLSCLPGDPGSVAYIVDRTLVLGPEFADVRTAFMSYSRPQDEEPHGPA